MIKKVLQIIEKYFLLQGGDRVVVALSGGADSCALLLVLKKLSQSLNLYLVAAHFNHGLRGAESDEDETFCKALAIKTGIKFITEKMVCPDVPRGMSPEDYFRQERYRFLERAAADEQAGKIALGHHLQDQAETVLINILRGSGLGGLKGIAPMRQGKFIRPLINVSKEEILAFLRDQGAAYRTDSTNESRLYLRNRIRGELIPRLKEAYNPRIEQHLNDMAEIIRRDDDFIDQHIQSILSSEFIQRKKNQITLSIDFFRTMHVSLMYRLIKTLLEKAADDDQGFSFSHIRSIVELALKGESGKILSLPHCLYVQKSYDIISFERGKPELPGNYEYPITIPGTLAIPERGINLSVRRLKVPGVNYKSKGVVCFDANKIRGTLVVRNRRPGDCFEPLGTRGSQKIKKLFIDRKIPRMERANTALIVDEESVLWIENLHLSDRVKVTPDTKEILAIEIRPLTQ